VLNIFGVFGHQSRAQLGKALPKLRDELGSSKVLYGLLALVLGIDVYLKLL
jgi:hypothetical protein